MNFKREIPIKTVYTLKTRIYSIKIDLSYCFIIVVYNYDFRHGVTYFVDDIFNLLYNYACIRCFSALRALQARYIPNNYHAVTEILNVGRCTLLHCSLTIKAIHLFYRLSVAVTFTAYLVITFPFF